MDDPNIPLPGMTPVAPVAPTDTSESLLRHYVTVVQRRYRWILLGLIVGLAAGVISSLMVTEQPITTRYYKATNTLVQDGVNTDDGTSNSSYTLSQAALQVQSQKLLDKVGETMGMAPDQVAAQLSAEVRTDVNAIDVTAIAMQPEAAVRLANTGAADLASIAAEDADTSANSQRDALEKQLARLQQQRQQLMTQIAGDPPNKLALSQQLVGVSTNISSVTEQLQSLQTANDTFKLSVLRPASAIQINSRGYNYRHAQNLNARNPMAPTGSNSSTGADFNEQDLSRPSGVSTSTRISLGAAAGGVLGLISAFLIEAWDDRVRRRDHVEELTELGVLTEIPQLSRDQSRDHHVAVEDEPTGVAAERYRSARAALSFAMGERDTTQRAGAPVLMVTSPGPAEGKTTTVANLAAAFADDGKRVLVIDGDFRRPAVRRYLAPVPNLVSPDGPSATRIEGVEFLPGPHDAATPELAVEELTRTLVQQRDRYDLVVLDTPPILTTNDAVEMLTSADAVLLVLRAGRTRVKAARRVAELLAQFRADTLGIVLNGCDRTEMNQYYGYGYGYNYGYLGKTTASSKSNRDTTRPGSADDDEHATTVHSGDASDEASTATAGSANGTDAGSETGSKHPDESVATKPG